MMYLMYLPCIFVTLCVSDYDWILLERSVGMVSSSSFSPFGFLFATTKIWGVFSSSC